MVTINQIYKCSVCGNLVEVVLVGGGGPLLVGPGNDPPGAQYR